MGFFDFQIDDAVEAQTLPAGEYLLEVDSAEAKTSKAGNPMMAVRLSAVDAPDNIVNPSSIFHHFLAPDNTDPKIDNMRKLDLLNFLTAANLPTRPPFEPENFIGARVWAVLVEEDVVGYGRQNRVKRWVKGK